MDDARTSRRTSHSRRTLLLGAALVALATICTAASGPAHAASAAPQVLDGEVADVLVRIRGGAICSGTPITGTRYVVTAAHCVLDAEGRVARRTVVRDDVEYTVAEVLVDTRYHEQSIPEFDAAVLVMEQVVPGPSAVLGISVPTTGTVTLAGYQPLNTDGSLLRGTNPHDRPLPSGADGGVVTVETAVAGCELLASSVEVRVDQLRVTCGLVPGASGGALISVDQGVPALVGVTSTVAADLSANGITPVSAVHRLLDDPAVYSHRLADTEPQPLRAAASIG